MRFSLRLPLSLALAASEFLASPSLAKVPSVYINNVRVDGISNQTLQNVDITFDDGGDIRITAKGYKITASEPVTPPPPATPPPALSTAHHFYIATMQPPSRSGAAQWDVDVYINQVYVKKFRSKDADPIFDITRFLKPGANVVHFTAKKEEGERQSVSPNDYFELVVGDGEMRAGQVMLNKITSYRRTAAETGQFNAETTLNLATDK